MAVGGWTDRLALARRLHQAGRLQEAEALYRELLGQQPSNPDVLCLLGTVCEGLKRLEEALAWFEQALAIRPEFPEAYNNLGMTLAKQKRLEEAVRCFQAALRLRPNYADAHNNLAIAYLEQERLPEAIRHLETTLRLQPHFTSPYTNLAHARILQGRMDEAMACLDTVLRLKPDDPEAHWQRAVVFLSCGRFQEGWQEFEWRWRQPGATPPGFAQPTWDGKPLAGRRILVFSEQGLGDTIQFVRFAPLVQQRGGRVLLVCQAPLVPLLGRCAGIDRLLTANSELPAFDVQAPLLSLPRLLETTVPTLPARVPYVFPSPQLVARWGATLGSTGGFKVGMTWQGSPLYPGDRQRSVPLACLAPLGAIAGVRLLSLQKAQGREQLGQWPGPRPLEDLGDRLDEQEGAFMDTAAVMRHLDLVITVNTAVAHLAGALGIPVWVALPRSPDWRWLYDREDTPWYPTMRLFRQEQVGDWTSVVARMIDQLQNLVRRARAGPGAPRP